MSGTLITLNVKLMYQTRAEGLEAVKPFTKPWFLTFAMFLGMLLALPVHLASGASRPDVPWSEVAWRCSFPAFCDLMATTLGSTGLMFVSASVFQICRGASVVFVAIFTVAFLKRSLNRSKITGVLLVVAALCVIGQASMKGAGAEAKDQETGKSAVAEVVLGMSLIIGAQVFQAVQLVWEEKQMKHLKLPPLLLCSIEGTFGSLLMLVVFFPVLSQLPGNDAHGCLESLADTIAMLQNSPRLRLLNATYVIAIFVLNVCGVYCSKVLSGMHRSLVQTGLRTMCVWLMGLELFKATGGLYGEPWMPEASPLEVLGFVIFLLGFCLYSGFVEIPSMCTPQAPYEYIALSGTPPVEALKTTQVAQQP